MFSSRFAEKTIVLNMLRMVATGEINPYPQQSRPPTQGRIPEEQEPLSDQPINPSRGSRGESDLQEAQANEFDWPNADLPFKLPEHDTVIRRSHSRLSSRQSGGRLPASFHQRLQQELDKQSTVQSSRLSTPSSKIRQRAASVSGAPISTEWAGRQRLSSSNHQCRPRSRSAGAIRNTSWEAQWNAPPPPVRVQVVREMLNSGGRHSGQHQRYTTRWINSQ